MKYLSFTIEDYRAVKNATIQVSNSLIPIIGINESGKTTVLQSILAFDKNSDKYNRGAHLIHKNKYETKDHSGKVVANILIDTEDDLESISEKLNLNASDSLYKTLQAFYKDKKTINLARIFPGKTYSVENEELATGTKQRQKELAQALYERLPFILYFDDFSDRVPTEITFNISKEYQDGYQIPPSTQSQEWHFILEEVFKRATEGGTTLSDFLKMKDNDDQTGVMSDIQDILHEQVVEDWKNYRTGFGEEPEDLRMQLHWSISDDKSKVTFKFQVQDRTTGKGRQFDIPQRSKGFQWFFNFIMKLKFNPKYHDDQKGAIYLLDEPGSYLHTSAQTELLKRLEDISETNTILYCTHSQFLLDPDVINIALIKIADKKKGNVTLKTYGSAGVSMTAGALTPLHQALHLKSGFFNKEIKYPVITEGITDYYLFDILKRYKKGFFKNEIDFVPGAGADHLKDLISHAIAFSEKYLILLDSDDKGVSAHKKYKDHFGSSEAEKFILYSLPRKKSDIELEDHLSGPDKKHLEKLTGVSDPKAALPVLYYGDEKNVKEFVKNLTDITIKNLGNVKKEVNKIVS